MKAALLAVTLLLLTTGASARECALWGTRYVHREWPNFSYRERYCRRWERPERVYAYERREDDPPRAYCQFDHPPMTATGDDKLEEDRARLSAQERWSINVGNRRGGRFSDIRYAANATADCIQVVPSSMTERAQASLGLRHWVCTVEAVPCAAPKIPQTEDTRAKRASEKADDDAGRKADPRIQYYEPQPEPKKRWYQRRRD